MRSLLMGGQACVFYGAAQFSRDLDLLVLADPENLTRLNDALNELQAVSIAVPPFFNDYLARGHAVHFRCGRPDIERLRIDVMSELRGVDDFETVWSRRTTFESEGVEIDLLGIEDLVVAKKTQRDKDWPMIRRLVERHYVVFRADASEEAIRFWLRELRTPELLREVIAEYPEHAHEASLTRTALKGDLDESLKAEEEQERAQDRAYWKPLREELQRLRFDKKKS